MKTILLVDDNVMLRMTFGRALRESGYNVIEADSGVKGLALARLHLPDLILSDVQMPGGDGTTLLRNIRNDPELRSRQVEASIRAGVHEALRLNRRKDDVNVTVSPCAVGIKASELGLIVEELVDNALKFSRAGTPVMVEFTADGQLVVADQGRGMTPKEVEQIGAFKQFDREKTAQQGLGLGLVLVQKFVSLYQARLHLDSYPGQGTQARVTFPVVKMIEDQDDSTPAPSN